MSSEIVVEGPDHKGEHHRITFKRVSRTTWYGWCTCGRWNGYSKYPERLKERSLAHLSIWANT